MQQKGEGLYIMKTFPKIITSWRHVLIEWEILSDRQGWIHNGDNQVRGCSAILRKSQMKPTVITGRVCRVLQTPRQPTNLRSHKPEIPQTCPGQAPVPGIGTLLSVWDKDKDRDSPACDRDRDTPVCL